MAPGRPLLSCPPHFSSPEGHMAQDRCPVDGRAETPSSCLSPAPYKYYRGHREIIGSRSSNRLPTKNSSPLVLKSMSLFSFLFPHPPLFLTYFSWFQQGSPAFRQCHESACKCFYVRLVARWKVSRFERAQTVEFSYSNSYREVFQYGFEVSCFKKFTQK